MTHALWVEFFAFMGGMLSTISFAPQVIKIWKERNPKAISLRMYIIFLTGICFWFMVGVLLNSPSMMFWNGITITLAVAIITMKIRFSKLNEREKGEWVNRNQLP